MNSKAETLFNDSVDATAPHPEAMSNKSHFFEALYGVTIAFMACVLAITDLISGNYESEMVTSINEKNAAFAWYQSKGIKETVLEGQSSLIKTMIGLGVVEESKIQGLESQMDKMKSEISRYKSEKKEILLGSKNLKESEWAQDVDGKLGQVVGAKEYEVRIEKLDKAGNQFDFASLLLQLSLVLGAIGLLIQNNRQKWRLYFGLVTVGCVGMAFSTLGYLLAN